MQRSRGIKILAGMAAFGLVAAACGSDDSESSDTSASDTSASDTSASETDSTGTGGGGDSAAADAEFTLFGAPTGVEGDALAGFLDVYNEETGSNIEFTGSDDFESQLRIRVDGGDPPAVAVAPQPASICEFADQGALVSLEDMGFDIAELEADQFGKFWVDLGAVRRRFALRRSVVPQLQIDRLLPRAHLHGRQGYAIPETWEEMIALSAADVGTTASDAVVLRLRERRRHRLGRAPTGSRTSWRVRRVRGRLRPVVQARDPVQ